MGCMVLYWLQIGFGIDSNLCFIKIQYRPQIESSLSIGFGLGQKIGIRTTVIVCSDCLKMKEYKVMTTFQIVSSTTFGTKMKGGKIKYIYYSLNALFF